MRVYCRSMIVWLPVILTLALAAQASAPRPLAAAPAAQGERCLVTGDKVASPARLRLGETVQVRLTLKPECPPSIFRAADIVLAIDQSRSMLNSGKLTAAKNAARVFVEATDLSLHTVAVLSFYGDADLLLGLSQDKPAIMSAIDSIDIRSGTNIAGAIDLAFDELHQNGRLEALPVIVLLSDGQPNRPAPDPETAAIRSANFAKLANVEIITVGLGSDASENLLKQLASSDADYHYAPAAAELEAIYRSIAVLVGDFALRDLALEDALSPDVALVGGSAVPAPTVNGKQLRWTVGLVPKAGLSWVYQVKPQRVGTYPTNDSAVATYTDVDGSRQEFVFPVPVIEVLEPIEQPCDQRKSWTVMVHAFPDSIGVSGSEYPGCNNRLDSGDWIQGTRYRLPNLEYELTDFERQKVLYRGKGVPSAGRVDQRVYIRVCEPPPYRLRLVTTVLGGYELCPNSPAERVITARDFLPLDFRRTEERYGFVR